MINLTVSFVSLIFVSVSSKKTLTFIQLALPNRTWLVEQAVLALVSVSAIVVSSKYTEVDWQLPLPKRTWSDAHILLALPSIAADPKVCATHFWVAASHDSAWLSAGVGAFVSPSSFKFISAGVSLLSQ